jgi:hypothetical protein
MKYLNRLAGKSVPLVVEGNAFNDYNTGSKVYHVTVHHDPEENKYYAEYKGQRFQISKNGTRKVIMRDHKTLVVKDKDLAQHLKKAEEDWNNTHGS